VLSTQTRTTTTRAYTAQPMTEFHDRPRFPRGFRCASRNCGIKAEGRDLSLFASDVDAAAAAVFTRNRFPGAPVVLGRETVRGGVLRAIVVNSRVSNVATGEEGVDRARRMAAAAAAEVGTTAQRVLVSSTGVIGVPLPIEKIEAGVRGMAATLGDDPLEGALGIMTTDTYPKALSCSVGAATLTVVAKGSGMIAPNMATMLAYIFTDAAVEAPRLDAMLREAVDATFNMLSVDGDTSTSDTCAILANGLAGPVPDAAFHNALHAACMGMTELLARDGEGATKLLRVVVAGAASDRDARIVARSIVESPLIKTMVHGADPNVGRLLMAIGKCTAPRIEPERVACAINGWPVIAGGRRAEFDEARARRELEGDTVQIDVDLGIGTGRATGWGCDLTEGYIRENAAYYSS
jgi:glutamate N-acetyltransferase / amino-acid N-acetyltransferase